MNETPLATKISRLSEVTEQIMRELGITPKVGRKCLCCAPAMHQLDSIRDSLLDILECIQANKQVVEPNLDTELPSKKAWWQRPFGSWFVKKDTEQKKECALEWWYILKEGDLWQAGGTYSSGSTEFVIGEKKTDVRPGTPVSKEMMIYKPRRRMK